MKILEKYKSLIGWLLLLITFFSIVITLNFIINIQLDSDMSSELILAKLLNKEKSIISTNWFYSTELRVFNTQLIFAPLFSFFSNWHIIRVVGTTILLFFLLLSFLYFCRQAKIENSNYLALLIIGCISNIYYLYVTRGLYYIPHLVMAFLYLGMLFKYMNKEKRRAWIIVLMLFLSFISGLGGPRQIVTLFVPTLIVCLINFLQGKKESKVLIASFSCTIVSIIGYIINTVVLSKNYFFVQYTSTNFISLSFIRLGYFLRGVVSSLGYNDYIIDELKGYTYFINFISAIFMGIVLCSMFCIIKKFNKIEKTHRFIALFVIISYVIFALLMCFTDVSFTQRHLIPLTVFCIPIVGIWINSLEKKIIKTFFYGFLIIYAILETKYYFDYNIYLAKNSEWKNNENYYYASGACENDFMDIIELEEIKNVLLNSNTIQGYAMFWNANVLTELSNGQIEVWIINDSSYDIDINHLREWLQVKEHIQSYPKNRMFLLLDNNIINNISHEDVTSNMVYKGRSKSLFIYDKYDDFVNAWKENN